MPEIEERNWEGNEGEKGKRKREGKKKKKGKRGEEEKKRKRGEEGKKERWSAGVVVQQCGRLVAAEEPKGGMECECFLSSSPPSISALFYCNMQFFVFFHFNLHEEGSGIREEN